MSEHVLHLGDCLEIMSTLEDNSVDAVITDPPYELGFMGKSWDSSGISFQVETWEAVHRVLKPGAFLFAFGGTRTWHRIAVAIEDAGFEVRDTVCWLHGQGFPKSYNISKAIDKKAGKEREVIEERYKSKHSGGSSYQWSEMNSETGEAHITAPATPEAELWEGWGTALKPAFEPIIVAMKPIDKNYVNNALTHGVAGLWIDGGRISTNEDTRRIVKVPRFNGSHYASGRIYDPRNDSGEWEGGDHPEGRWPSNVIHDGSDEVMSLFPEGRSSKSKKSTTGHHFTAGNAGEPTRVVYKNGEGVYSDNGSAAKFFYCAKASKKERNMGLGGMPEKVANPNYGKGGFKRPTGEPDRQPTPAANHHPTVKPLALMQYLVRLTKTPTGGIVCDPFMGSGTTGMACVLEDRDFIGIEINPEYYEIAEKRIAEAKMQLRLGI